MTKTDILRGKFDEIFVYPRHVCVLRTCTQIYHSAIMWVKGVACEILQSNNAQIIVESIKQGHPLSFLPLGNP